MGGSHLSHLNIFAFAYPNFIVMFLTSSSVCFCVVVPVKHFSNVYIWVHLKPTQEQLNNILGLSKDFYYDRKKELLVVRSACLDTAIAQATLMSLYATGKISFYDLVNNDMLTNYYVGILPGKPACRKVRKALYRILKDIKKMK